MNIKPIRNEEDYQQALARLEQIFDAQKGSKDGDKLEALSTQILAYEEAHFHIDMHDEDAKGPSNSPA